MEKNYYQQFSFYYIYLCFFTQNFWKIILQNQMSIFKVAKQKQQRSSQKKTKSSLYYSSNSLLKPILSRLRKQSQNDLTLNPIQQSKIQVDQRQRLSSYQAFIKKLKKQNITKVPSTFQLLTIEDKKLTFPQDDYETINFKILSYTNVRLVEVACEIISKFGLSDICGVFALKKMINQISKGYNVVSYHNFSHGFSVMHMFYHLTKFDRKFRILYTKEQIGWTLIAALAHDLNHQGTNNSYEVKIDSMLAKIAGKEAILQKMHIRTFFQILKVKNITLIDSSKNGPKIKQLITRLILATDVTKHFKGLERLKSMRQNNQFDHKNDQHRYFVLEQAFHASDIGNPCLQFKQYMNWAALLSYQFQNQATLEEMNQLQITQAFKFKGMKQFYQGQIGFINCLVQPLWKQLSNYWSGFNPFIKNLQDNTEQLKRLIGKQKKQ